jgi:hypothetical protein
MSAQTSWITVRVRAESEALHGTPVMISIIRDGAIVQQTEEWVNAEESFVLDPGLYDVRLEAPGVVTMVKRGITVTLGNTTTVVGGPLEAGKGLTIIEYATGGFTREELAERLTRLERAMRSVEEAVDSLRAAHGRS